VSREAVVIAVTVALTTVGAIVALPYLNEAMGGRPPATVAPPSARPSATARATPASPAVPPAAYTAPPSTDDPGIGQEAFADPAAAVALRTAEAGADADIQRLRGIRSATLVGHQRTLRCVKDPLKPGMLICTVYAYAYVAWDGGFTHGHDLIIDALSDPCSFSETNQFDWTPPDNNAREQQGGCPGRPNMWVHWSTGPFTNGVLDCEQSWYNDCQPTTGVVVNTLPDFAWMGRMRSGFPFPLPDTATEPDPNPAPASGVTAPDGQELSADDAVFGDETAQERTAAVLRANRDTKSLTRVSGVVLAGTREALGCAEGQTNAVRNDASIRLTCHVETVQYLVWDGNFDRGRQALLKVLSRICPWKNEDNFPWKPSNAHIMSQEHADCPGESPAMWVDFAHAGNPKLVYPCFYDTYRECTPDVDVIAKVARRHDWAARVAIRYEFYNESA